MVPVPRRRDDRKLEPPQRSSIRRIRQEEEKAEIYRLPNAHFDTRQRRLPVSSLHPNPYTAPYPRDSQIPNLYPASKSPNCQPHSRRGRPIYASRRRRLLLGLHRTVRSVPLRGIHRMHVRRWVRPHIRDVGARQATLNRHITIAINPVS